MAADAFPCRHRQRSKEAQQGIAPNHDPPRVEPEGWQEVQLAAERRRRSWWEDIGVRASQRSQNYLAELFVNRGLDWLRHRRPVKAGDVVNIFEGFPEPSDLCLLCGLWYFLAAVRAVVADPPARNFSSAVRASTRTIGWRGTAHRWSVVCAESCVRRPSSMPFVPSR